jgi:hypothetical protein
LEKCRKTPQVRRSHIHPRGMMAANPHALADEVSTRIRTQPALGCGEASRRDRVGAPAASQLVPRGCAVLVTRLQIARSIGIAARRRQYVEIMAVMSEPGWMALLNGAPRNGESSLVTVLQQMFEGPWMNLDVDVLNRSSCAAEESKREVPVRHPALDRAGWGGRSGRGRRLSRTRCRPPAAAGRSRE